MSLSIGVFFSLMIAGLASTLPRTLTAGLTSQGVPLATATKIAHLPPVSVVFSAMLGYNPMQNLLGPTGVLSKLPAANAATLTGKQFFPTLISGPFHHGLMVVFTAAALMSVTGAVVSLLRGKPARLDDAPAKDAASGAPAAGTDRVPLNGAAPLFHAANGARPNGASGNGRNGASGNRHLDAREEAPTSRVVSE
jgi:hypothetical protein